MATKRFYATRDLKNPGYGTRMIRAGEPIDLDGPKARLYLALGAVSPTKPKAAAAPDSVTVSVNGDQVATVTTKPRAPRKAATRKRTTKRKP